MPVLIFQLSIHRLHWMLIKWFEGIRVLLWNAQKNGDTAHYPQIKIRISRKLYGSNYVSVLFLRAIKRVVLITNITFAFVSVETKELLVMQPAPQLTPPARTSLWRSSAQTFLCRQLCWVNINPTETLDPSRLAAAQFSRGAFTAKLFI